MDQALTGKDHKNECVQCTQCAFVAQCTYTKKKWIFETGWCSLSVNENNMTDRKKTLNI